MDWKDALRSLRDPSETTVPDDESTPASNAEPVKKQRAKLNVVMERKGRGGKTATIIEGFEIEDSEIDDIARRLKQKLGIGGSARGGEILLQGDCRDKVRSLLREMGFKA